MIQVGRPSVEQRTGRRRSNGMTLLELVLVVLILGVLSYRSLVGQPAVSDLTVRAEADRLARDLRRLQSLALTRSASVCVAVDGGGYRAWQVTATVPCSAAANNPPLLLDPALGGAFSVRFAGGVTSSCGSPASACDLYFRYLSSGQIGGAAGPVSVRLAGLAQAINVNVALETGFVSVQ